MNIKSFILSETDSTEEIEQDRGWLPSPVVRASTGNRKDPVEVPARSHLDQGLEPDPFYIPGESPNHCITDYS